MKYALRRSGIVRIMTRFFYQKVLTTSIGLVYQIAIEKAEEVVSMLTCILYTREYDYVNYLKMLCSLFIHIYDCFDKTHYYIMQKI